jgi:hypothetical protein
MSKWLTQRLLVLVSKSTARTSRCSANAVISDVERASMVEAAGFGLLGGTLGSMKFPSP